MRRRLLPLLLAVSFLLSGCWDRIEVVDLAIITAAGLDPAEEGVRLTVGVVVPHLLQGGPGGGGGGGGQRRPAVFYTATGKSVTEATGRIQARLARRIFWSHLRFLVLSEEYARMGVSKELDFWSRDREPRPSMQVLVTPGSAQDLLTVQPKLERLLSEAIREKVHYGLHTKITFREFMEAVRSPYEGAISPVVEVFPGVGDGPDAVVTGLAAFKGGKLVGRLDLKESETLLWLRNQSERGIVTAAVPGGGEASMQVVRTTTQLRPVRSGSKLRMEIHIRNEGDLVEATAPLALEKEAAVTQVQALMEREARTRMEQVIKRAQQEWGVDLLRFGDAVRRRYPADWESGLQKRWADEFPRVEVSLAIQLFVRRTGGHGHLPGIEQGEQPGTTGGGSQHP